MQALPRRRRARRFDAAFPKLTILSFSLDDEDTREALAVAGYQSRLIPLFALPKDDGTPSGKQMEGSIHGTGSVDYIDAPPSRAHRLVVLEEELRLDLPRSSSCFRSAPSVGATSSASSALAPSDESARAQSIVSAMTGACGARASAPRATNADELLGERLPMPGTRSSRMASSRDGRRVVEEGVEAAAPEGVGHVAGARSW